MHKHTHIHIYMYTHTHIMRPKVNMEDGEIDIFYVALKFAWKYSPVTHL